jgi:hypothetical protein
MSTLIKTEIESWSGMGLTGYQAKYYKFLLENCKEYKDEIRDEAYDIPYSDINIKECFKNSLIVSLTTDQEYVQGFYMTSLIAMSMEHAFNINDKGQVLDHTARKFGIKVKERYGMIIPKEFLWEYVETDQHETALRAYFKSLKL